MKKILLVVVMVLMFASPVIADAPVNVVVNGKVLSTPGLIIDSKTYVPLRAVGEELGAQVNWDGNQVTVNNIKEPVISGDAKYKLMVVKALQLLKEKDPQDYELVCRNTKDIIILSERIQTKAGEAYAVTGAEKFKLSPALFEKNNIPLLASTMVHESSHLCNDKNGIWNSSTTENIAHLHQISALRILGASQQDIDGVEQTRLLFIK